VIGASKVGCSSEVHSGKGASNSKIVDLTLIKTDKTPDSDDDNISYENVDERMLG
jgi:hypothetical protein